MGISARMEANCPVMVWKVENSSAVLSRREVSWGGKTSFERCKGKQACWPGGRLGKLMSLLHEGMHLGAGGAIGKLIAGIEDGIWRTRTVQRRPREERWSAAKVGEVRGAPWETGEDGEEAERGAMEGRIVDLSDGVPLRSGEVGRVREDARRCFPRSCHTADEDLQPRIGRSR